MTRRILAAITMLGLVVSSGASAQRVDSATVGARPAPRAPAANRAPIAGPPISPRRALLYSFLIPGLGQTKLDRPNAGALYAAVEIGSIAMIRKSQRSLATAESYPQSVIVGYSLTDSVFRYRGFRRERVPRPIREATNLPLRIASRKTQVEDWMAVLLFNHFFSGADAFVAAQLWDLPTVLKAEAGPRGASVTTRVYW